MCFGFSREIAWRGLCRQRHSSVGPPRCGRERGLNRPAHGGNAVPAELIEGFKKISRPACTQPGKDLLSEAPQPMTLSRWGTAGRPPEGIQTMSKALTDIGNGSLESVPVTDRASPEHLPAMAAPIPGKPDCPRASIEPRRYEPMAPQPPPTIGTQLFLGPLIPTTDFNQTLDRNVHEEYQGDALCGPDPLCSGVKGAATPFTPFPPQSESADSIRRHNLTNSHFQSRHRERFHRLCVTTICKTTGVGRWVFREGRGPGSGGRRRR